MPGVRNSESRGWGSLSNPFANPVEDIEGGVPFEDLPSSGSQTTTLNGRTDEHPQIKKIKDGQYYCSICHHKITSGQSQEEEVWECGSCYHILHFACVADWAVRERQHALGGNASISHWPCPQCLKSQCNVPTATCWCGKLAHVNGPFMDVQPSNDVLNGCQSFCGKVGDCSHKNRTRPCDKLCHPGPCDAPCSSLCVQQLAATTTATDAKPSWWRRLKTRYERQEKPGRGATTAILALIITLYYSLWAVLASFHIPCYTQPLQHRKFTEYWMPDDSGYTVTIVMGALISGFLIIGFAYSICGVFIYTRLTHLFNCNDSSTKKHRKRIMKTVLWVLFLLGAVGMVVIIPVMLAFGVDRTWNNQMKNSCNGLDTRALMRYGTGEYSLNSINGPLRNQTLSLASRYDIKKHNPEPFEYYERLSGGSDTERNYFVVDVDVANGAWRLLRTSGPDIANKFLATGYKKIEGKYFSKPPATKIIYTEQIKNGTFHGVKSPSDNSRFRHMHIPELNFYIANMFDFMNKKAYEPFLRVFIAFGKSDEEMLQVAEQKWTDENDASVMMRTASFGHGHQALSMCMREGQFGRYEANEMQESVSEDMLIAFAVITAHWKRVNETNLRGDGYDG